MFTKLAQEIREHVNKPPINMQRYLKLYDNFDAAHDRRHVDTVRRYAMQLAEQHLVDQKHKVDLAAVLHDIGLQKGRDRHEHYGADMVRSDKYLRRRFSADEIEELANTVARHRASTGDAKTTLDKIISDADRLSSENMLRRAYDYRLSHHPNMPDDDRVMEAAKHVKEKYGPGGRGTRTYFPESADIIQGRSAPVITALEQNDIAQLRKLLGQ